MNAIPVPVLIVINILCYTCASFFSKRFANAYRGDSASATPIFSVIFGLFVGTAVLAVGAQMRFSASPATWGFGLAAGTMLFLFNLGVINASLTGPYALQSIFKCSGSVVMPMLFSVFWWGDKLQAHQFAGIVVMLAAFVVLNSKGLSGASMSRVFLMWIVMLFVVNGIFGILMDSQQRVMQQAERCEMIIITYYCSAVISVVYLLATRGCKALPAFRMGVPALGYTLGASLTTSVAVYTLMLLLGRMTSSIFYTLQNGVILSLSVLLGSFVLKEKLSRSTIVGVILSLISIVLLTI